MIGQIPGRCRSATNFDVFATRERNGIWPLLRFFGRTVVVIEYTVRLRSVLKLSRSPATTCCVFRHLKPEIQNFGK